MPQWSVPGGSAETQPGEGVIDPDLKTKMDQEPYKIPAAYEWFHPDVTDDADLTAVHDLLDNHYVEDSDEVFRFAYSKEFLRWALTGPGWRREWHLGVRVKASGKIVGFIAVLPATIRVKGEVHHVGCPNFLCVHRQIRSKRLAPVMIKEANRRVILSSDIIQVLNART